MFSMIFFLFFAFSHSNMSINHKIDKKSSTQEMWRGCTSLVVHHSCVTDKAVAVQLLLPSVPWRSNLDICADC